MPKKAFQSVLYRCNKRLFPKWRRFDNHVKFSPDRGAFVGDAQSRPEFSAILYYDLQALFHSLDDYEFESALELGSGYGRLTPWIAKQADETFATDITTDSMAQGKQHHPDIPFIASSATSLPFENSRFDLIVGWTVLMHIPPDIIENAADEIERVLTADGRVVICEMIEGETTDICWPRSTERYEELFTSLELTTSYTREVNPSSLSPGVEVMIFEQ
jgi:SAM-dependent methyltransferase